jgi:hypothetical protein
MTCRPSATLRFFLASTLLLAAATTVLADAPNARTQTRLVYDPTTRHIILFGGTSALDAATRMAFEHSDTWEWTGRQWFQRYTATTPPGRSAHVMVYDSNRSQIVMFGGRIALNVETNDTWIYKDNDWQRVDTPSAPEARLLPGAAFDPIRDRVVLFGGRRTVPSGRTVTQQAFFDTWEFDGTTWTLRSASGPQVDKPILIYDKARNQILMLGINTTSQTLMYIYDGANGTWTQAPTGTTLPPCVNESAVAYQTHNDTIFLTGGTCFGSGLIEEAWQWDGQNWTEVELTGAPERVFGHGLAYDEQSGAVFQFGGSTSRPIASTFLYRDGVVVGVGDFFTPSPRSLHAFQRDPVNNTIFLYGGINDNGALPDFWSYQFGRWTPLSVVENSPLDCVTISAFDTERNRLMLFCNTNMFEWDGSAFTSFAGLERKPPFREFAKMAYDPTLRKAVLFGGFDTANYLQDTWTWDGTAWTEVKPRRKPPARTLQTMWYDSTQRKVIMYGGIGRPTPEDRVERYDDMWSFDGTNWTEIEITNTPGRRFGAQATVDPRTNKLLLFGGIRVDTNAMGVETQVYTNDLWEWDGSAWREIPTTNTPPARENAGFEYDPTTDSLVLFGGWSGFFRSDRWILDTSNYTWRVMPETGPPRRRAARR